MIFAKFATTATDEKVHNIDYYNLEMITPVGYRAKRNLTLVFGLGMRGVKIN